MTLDNYWVKSKPVYMGKNWVKLTAIYTGKDYKLRGCMFNEHGNGGFRGKVYNKFIEDMTKCSLYNELEEANIKHIAETLSKLKYDEVWQDKYNLTEKKFKGLKEMFNDYAQIKGIKLIPWKG